MSNLLNSLRSGGNSRPSDEHGVEELLKQVQQRSMSCTDAERKEIGNMVKRVRDHKKPNNPIEALSKKLTSVTISFGGGGGSNSTGSNGAATLIGSSHHSSNSQGSATAPSKSAKALAIEESLAAAAAAASAPRPASSISSPLKSVASPPGSTEIANTPTSNPSPLQASLLSAKNKTTDLFRSFSKNLQNPLSSSSSDEAHTQSSQQQQQQQQTSPQQRVGQLLRGFGSPRRTSGANCTQSTAQRSPAPKTAVEPERDSNGVLLLGFESILTPAPTMVDLPPLAPSTTSDEVVAREDEKKDDLNHEQVDNVTTVDTSVAEQEDVKEGQDVKKGQGEVDDEIGKMDENDAACKGAIQMEKENSGTAEKDDLDEPAIEIGGTQ